MLTNRSQENTGDVFTMPLARPKFEMFRAALRGEPIEVGLREMSGGALGK